MSDKPWVGNNQYDELSPEDRFWEKVKRGLDDECWEWQAGRNAGGYGTFGTNHKSYLAHRFSWEIHYDKIPSGLCVLHQCDNPPCVNPDHLFLGNRLINKRDSIIKGRMKILRGESHSCAVLNEDDVHEIRRLYATGKYTQREIAERFEVGRSQIANILCGLAWTHI
jgi:hypothetical protein